ncbi:MAG TPA: hypothetical protein VK624_18700, partial [Steroidobacteraceae bacterium]|nr:hypothetical protein [Steroidobacteraceae bacterium]
MPATLPPVEVENSAAEQVELAGVAKITLPRLFLPSGGRAELSQSSDPGALDRFHELASVFQVGSSTVEQVRVVLSVAPLKDATFTAILTVPPTLAIHAGFTPRVFAAIYEAGGQEVVESFQPFPSVWDEYSQTVTASLPSWVFTKARRADGRYEALLMIGTTPNVSTNSAGTTNALSAYHAAGCSGSIGWPTAAGAAEKVTSPFEVRDLGDGEGLKPHRGIDFGVPPNTDI